MTTSSVTSNSSTVDAQLQAFYDGKTTISKSDLTSIVASEVSSGETVNSSIMDLIDSYESIDKNDDGKLTYQEYSTYKNSTAGMLSSLSLPDASSYSLLDTDLFTNSSDDTFSILESGSSSSSGLSSLLDSLSSNSTTTTAADSKTASLLDYLD
jgi:hypothetical protein